MNAEIRQQLLELVYDLLSESEAAVLRARIESEPEMAAAYHEAQQTARLLAEAARLPAAPIAIAKSEKAADPGKRPAMPPTGPTTTPPVVPAKNGLVVRGKNKPRKTFARAANWTVGLAAAVLVLISVGGYFYHRDRLAKIAADHLRLIVTGPASMQSGVAAEYAVSATAIDGRPLPARIEVALSGPDGKRLKAYKETADEQGNVRVAIPADLKLPLQTHLRVVAWHGDSHEEAETAVAVEPPRYDAYLSVDRPLYQPGDTVFYRALVLSRFGLRADRDAQAQFEILDPSGAKLANSQSVGACQRGVAAGSFAIPDGLAGGQYTLVVRDLGGGGFAERKRAFFVRRYRLPRLKKELEFQRDSYAAGQTVTADFKAQRAEGGAAAGAKLHVVATVDAQTVFDKNVQANDAGSLQIEFKLPEKIQRGDGQLSVAIDDGGTRETLAKTIPINLGKIDVAFYPEGGDLAAGLENHVYFVGRNPLGKPVHLTGMVVASGPGAAEQTIAAVETSYEGMGSFHFTPRAGQTYRLKVTSPPDVKNEPRLPEAAPDRRVALSAGAGVFAAGAPLEFIVRSSEGGRPLVAAAYCRGVEVGQQAFVTKQGDNTANPIVIPLGENVGGVIRLTVYDYSVAPPHPVAERLVYRRPARRLKVRAVEDGRRYAPGQKVDVSLLVTDEKGEPAPAVLGVAVVDDALLNMADDRTASMPTHFLLTGEIEKPEDLENADFYLSDGSKGKTTAATALDLLLGTQGWRRFVDGGVETEKVAQARVGWAEQAHQDPRKMPAEATHGGPAQARPTLRFAAEPAPFLYDNISQIRSNYDQCIADYQADRTQALNTLTTASFFGGLGLVLLVAMLGLMRIVSGIYLWASAIGATVCCLILGAILMDPGRLGPSQGAAIAFVSYQPPMPERLAEEHGTGMGGMGVVGDDRDEPVMLEKFAGYRAPDTVPLMMVVPTIIIQGEEEKLLPGGPEPFAGEPRDRGVVSPAVVREYAHQHVVDKPGVRSDFAETLYWNPLLVTDAYGKASFHFELSDAVTAFRVTADAHSDGVVGSGRAEIVARIPFNLEPKLPLEVSAGDRIDLPVAVVNDTRAPLPVELKLDAGKLVALDGPPTRKLALAADSRGREFFALNVTGQNGRCNLTFHGTAGSLTDSVSRRLRVVPPGFPKMASYGGQLSSSQEQEVVVTLPERWVPGSLEVSLGVFPTTLATLQKGLDGILQEPNGCFEQASSSNYPNVMTMRYMDENHQAEPAVTRRTRELLGKGYARLTGYECKQRGYEWFGGDPGHEALTAYGLLQFRDMQQVFGVDPAMISRTAEWLLARRDGHGGYQRNPRALDSFGNAPADVTDAYITWALAESGQTGIDAEVRRSIAIGEKSDDPYVIALAAMTALDAGGKDAGRKLLEKLAGAQADDGHLDGRQGSITRSGGLSLQVETTALGALAWLKATEFAARAEKAIAWITKNRQGNGGFGSTQATVLALKALVEHARANRRTPSAGTLTVERDGRTIGQHTFSAGVRDVIAIDSLAAGLTPGDNRLTLRLTGDNQMPYLLSVAYRTTKPESSAACPVRLTTKLVVQASRLQTAAETAALQVKAGETVAMSAELVNRTDQGQPMTVAIVGLPAGLEPRADQLEELKRAGTADYYEINAREIVFYWRSLAPKRRVVIQLDLIAAVPGKYVGPASRAYLYYTPEHKHWCEPLAVEIGR
jgi:alpha-2-macroglobulin-like protein